MAPSTIHLHPPDKWEGYNCPSQRQASNHLRDGDFDLQNQQQKGCKTMNQDGWSPPIEEAHSFPMCQPFLEKIVIKITISMILANSKNHDHDQNSVNHDHNFNDQYPDKPRPVWRSIRFLKNSSLAGTLSVTCGIIIIIIIIHHIYHIHHPLNQPSHRIVLIIQAISAYELWQELITLPCAIRDHRFNLFFPSHNVKTFTLDHFDWYYHQVERFHFIC